MYPLCLQTPEHLLHLCRTLEWRERGASGSQTFQLLCSLILTEPSGPFTLSTIL